MTGKTLAVIAKEAFNRRFSLDNRPLPNREIAAWTEAANSVKAAIAKWPKCSKCNGVGYLFSADNACPACGGLGRVEND